MDDKIKYADGYGATSVEIERGFKECDEGLPPKEIQSEFGSYPNPDRMVYDDEAGEMVDAYHGGFVSRHPEID